MFPVMAAVCIFWMSCVQYAFAHRLADCRTPLLAALIICMFLSLGDCLYSIRVVCLASMMGIISVDLASNQLGVFAVFYSKVARAVRCLVSRRISHLSGRFCGMWGTELSLSKASANCDMRFGCDILLTSIRGSPSCFLVRWNVIGCSLILQHPKEWSVLQSAP